MNDSTARKKHPSEEAEHPAFQVIDKRHFVDLDHPASELGIEEKPRFPSFVEELMGRLAAAERRFEERKLQMQEEISRTRSRLESEFERRISREVQALVLPFLEILDNLERALDAAPADDASDSLRVGVQMIADLFRAKLKTLGVETVPVLGLPFDPNISQAVGVVPVSDPARDAVVVEEILHAYRMGESLLRPAHVRVGSLRE